MKGSNYQFKIDYWVIVLFVALMLPNIIWRFYPAPNDLLRKDSVTPLIDTIASISQILLLASLCFFRNKLSEKIDLNKKVFFLVVYLLVCLGTWGIYYQGIVNHWVILSLSLSPCLCFGLYATNRKNRLALLPLTVFTICHGLFGLINFIL